MKYVYFEPNEQKDCCDDRAFLLFLFTRTNTDQEVY